MLLYLLRDCGLWKQGTLGIRVNVLEGGTWVSKAKTKDAVERSSQEIFGSEAGFSHSHPCPSSHPDHMGVDLVGWGWRKKSACLWPSGFFPSCFHPSPGLGAILTLSCLCACSHTHHTP